MGINNKCWVLGEDGSIGKTQRVGSDWGLVIIT